MRVTRVSAQPVPRVGVPWAQLGWSSSRYRAISRSSHLITNRRLGRVQGGGTFSIGTMCGWSVPDKLGVCGSQTNSLSLTHSALRVWMFQYHNRLLDEFDALFMLHTHTHTDTYIHIYIHI